MNASPPAALTPDNPLLSRPTGSVSGDVLACAIDCTRASGPEADAINCTSGNGSDNAIDCTIPSSQVRAINCINSPEARVAMYVRDSLARNTRRAYVSDLAHFEQWGGGIPASAENVATYLATHAQALSVATLARRMASISKAHEAGRMVNPTRSELVRATMRGIKRQRGRAQREAKPLLRDDLLLVLDAIGERPKDVRDRALLLIGFASALQRSELVALDAVDIEHVRQGVVLHLRRSKTDQEGLGQKIGIPHGRTRWCPVHALDAWLSASGISEGSIFRSVDRHGRIHSDRLSGEAVALVIKDRMTAAGMDPHGYSGHSLRAGLATSAAQAGVPTWKIRAQTGHASDAMLARYVRSAELFNNNAAGALL